MIINLYHLLFSSTYFLVLARMACKGTVTCKWHAFLWSVSLFRVYKLEIASLYMLTRSRETDYEIACPLITSRWGGGGGQKVPALISTIENFLDIREKATKSGDFSQNL